MQFHRNNFIVKPNNNDEENKCGVCLELFEENQTLRRFPCRHVYHKECGDRWLQVKIFCNLFIYFYYSNFRKIMFVQSVENHQLKTINIKFTSSQRHLSIKTTTKH